MDCIYKRGNIYWIRYYRNGKPYLELTPCEKETTVKNLLREREEEVAKGQLSGDWA